MNRHKRRSSTISGIPSSPVKFEDTVNGETLCTTRSGFVGHIFKRGVTFRFRPLIGETFTREELLAIAKELHR